MSKTPKHDSRVLKFGIKKQMVPLEVLWGGNSHLNVFGNVSKWGGMTCLWVKFTGKFASLWKESSTDSISTSHQSIQTFSPPSTGSHFLLTPNWIEELRPNVITSPPMGSLAASVSTSSGAQLEMPPTTQGGAHTRRPWELWETSPPTNTPPCFPPRQILLPACTSPPQGKSPC